MLERATTRIIIAAMTALPAAAALAADDPASGGKASEEVGALPTITQGLWSGITALVVFGLVAAILLTQVWPKITGALAERENKILDEIRSAEQAREQAKAALEQYEASLAEARAEAQKMLDDTKTQQQKLAADLRAKNDAEISDMKDRATRDIEAAKRAALGQIYSEASTLATTIASKILARELSPEDQSRLLDEALGELKGGREMAAAGEG